MHRLEYQYVTPTQLALAHPEHESLISSVLICMW